VVGQGEPAASGQPELRRRLAVIAVLDVVGYSRMIGHDDEGTVRRWNALRAEVIDARIAAAHGHVVKSTGDGLLLEFISALEAVRCALEIQQATAVWNEALPEEQRLRLRFGIALGDVVPDGPEIHGDGVNIAVRLQSVAEPGSIVVSNSVREQVAERIDDGVVDLGSLELKNIVRPVHAFRIGGRQSVVVSARVSAATDWPSIAVLPFVSAGGDPAQDYLIDGVVEEVITSLSHFRWLKVIARSATFTLKGRQVDLRKVAEEFGVRYVLTGTARSSGARVRVTAELVDATTATQLWSDRFEGEAIDVFKLQDKIAEGVIAHLQPKLVDAEVARARRKPTDSLTAYDYYLQALPLRAHVTRESYRQAIELLGKAIALDPNFAPALALAAMCRMSERDLGWVQPNSPSIAEGVRLAHAAIAADPDDPIALTWAGHTIASIGRDPASGLALIERALRLCPNYAEAWSRCGMTRIYVGDLDGAIAAVRRSLELTPVGPGQFQSWYAMGFAHLFAGRYEDAIAAVHSWAKGRPPTSTGCRIMIAALAKLNRLDEALAVARDLRAVDPDLRVSTFAQRTPINRPEQLAVLIDGLRAVGIPE
jgi:TolB-like protein/class 3 adenylate cyclase